MTYALGRRIEAFDMAAVRKVIRDAGAQDLKLSAFVLGVVNSPAFRMNRVEPIETTREQRDQQIGDRRIQIDRRHREQKR